MKVVVTGGATSLGLEISRKFRAGGAKVFALDIDGDAVAALAPEDGITGFQLDVLQSSQVEAAFARIFAQTAFVDVLVNNVGLSGPRAPIEEVSEDDWNRTIGGSVGAAFLCTRAVIPQMKEKGDGAIVNISSSSAVTGLPNRTPYVVAKAALEAFTRNCAREFGPFNIRVNAVRPGALDNARMRRIIQTQATERSLSFDQTAARFLRYFSMRSLISLEEVAEVVTFLASDKAKHITGQCVGVDGNAEWEE